MPQTPVEHTRCPYPDCREIFEAAGFERQSHCPRCSRVLTVRSLQILREIDKRWMRYAENHEVKEAPRVSKFSVIVEDVRSLWNVGSIFRTADGAGFSPLYLCGITGFPPRKEIAKTSLGAEENVDWRYFPHALEILPSLKEQGAFVCALERGPNSIPLSQAIARQAIAKPLCLVIGNEVTGISAEVLASCDLICDLPMRGLKESLNVAVAFGIAAYMLTQ